RVMPAGVRNVTSHLSRTRLYAAAHRLIGSTSAGSPEGPAGRDNVLPAEVDAILDRTVGPESYVRDDQSRSQVLLHFTSTLHRIIDIAQHSGADIILVEPASNLRDCAPFKSQHRADLT